MSSQTITPGDRLSFTLFLALACHALVIFGIGFAKQIQAPTPNSLEVTLVSNPDTNAPEDADFIAQANKQGSGSVDEKREMTTDQQSAYHDSHTNEVNLTPLSARQPSSSSRLFITSIGVSPQSVASEQQASNQHPELPLPAGDTDNLVAPSDDIATLEARLAQQKQAYAKRPRINFVDSASAMANFEAQYINTFRREVEAMGTRNFPAEALAKKIFGNVRLRVDIATNGDINNIKLLHSSGYAILDRAAVRSIKLAAPFAPFTRKMRQHYDVLAIIRTWRFDLSSTLTSSYDG